MRIDLSPNPRNLVMGASWVALAALCCYCSARSLGAAQALIEAGQFVAFPVLAAIDLAVRQVPTALLTAGSIWTLLVLTVSGGLISDIHALAFIGLFAAPLILVNLFRPRSIGAGDVRLAAYIGPVLSFHGSIVTVPDVLLIGSLLAVAATLGYYLFTGIIQKKIPLVPFLLGGVVTVQLLSLGIAPA